MMATTNKVPRKLRFATIPHSVEVDIRKLGQNLRAARLRRNLSIEDVAQKIGISRFVVADAEKGKSSTGIAVYASLLWTYGLLDQLTEVAGPTQDRVGAALSLTRTRAGASRGSSLSNDF